MKITKEDAIAEAGSGITIPEKEFDVSKKRKGPPSEKTNSKAKIN